MSKKIKVLGTVKKDHLMEMQLHTRLDTRTFLLEYERYALEYDPSRIKLYSNQGNVLILGEKRSIVLLIDSEEKKAA